MTRAEGVHLHGRVPGLEFLISGRHCRVGPCPLVRQRSKHTSLFPAACQKFFPLIKKLSSSKVVHSPEQSRLGWIIVFTEKNVLRLAWIPHCLCSWGLPPVACGKRRCEFLLSPLKLGPDKRYKILEGDLWSGVSSSYSWHYLGTQRPLVCAVTAQVQINIFITVRCQGVQN